MRHNVPSWLNPLDGKPGVFVADPDEFFPELLAEMASVTGNKDKPEGPWDLPVNPDDPTRYDVEVALMLVKRIVTRVTRGHPHAGDKGVTLLIRGDDGRKTRWRTASFHEGNKPDISKPSMTAERNRSFHRFWDRLR